MTRNRSGPPASLVTPALLEQVRERAQIVDLFAAADLRRAGREFLARCPWHDDRRPSLTVSPKRNRVHCFVCGKGTDAIGWLQEQQGMSFQEAVLELARRTGLTVAEGDPAAQRRFEQEWRERRALMAQRSEQRARFQDALEQQLQEADGAGEAAAYLQSRGISVDSARQWQLGTAGGRLMIPLQDPAGQVVGFCGRAMGQQQPKYRNSAGDLLFQRNGLVFGLDQAAEAIRREGTALLVEGPLDVIQLHQAGFRHAVACLGTSVSAMQLQLLRRHGLKQLLIALDGDAAGQAATEKLLVQLQDALLGDGLQALVVPLPEGQDADGLLRSPGGIAAMKALLASAPHWLEWRLARVLAPLSSAEPAAGADKPGQGSGATPYTGQGSGAASLECLQAVERAGQALVDQLPEGVLRRTAQQRLEQALRHHSGVPQEPLEGSGSAAVAGGIQSGVARVALPEVWSGGLLSARQRLERRVLRLFIHAPDCRELLGCLALEDPAAAVAMEWLRQLAAVAAATDLAAMVLPLATQLPGSVAAWLRQAAAPGPEVIALLQRDPQAELQALIEALEPVT
ncbi:DNA primase [Synechococcus sp. WH 8101]|uniref:DNA primase n=1 Tax=Synechococcus sp. WH 8101 TaxID=59932 RepID=UPI00164C3BFD|nr:CHC2 zinc finger domain-containing protein [Synechococcus sp. WH 8101]